MINVIHRAFDEGVTFFDTLKPTARLKSKNSRRRRPVQGQNRYRHQVSWNIDQQTGKRLPVRLNSRPEHIRQVVDNMLKRLRTDRIDFTVSTPC